MMSQLHSCVRVGEGQSHQHGEGLYKRRGKPFRDCNPGAVEKNGYQDECRRQFHQTWGFWFVKARREIRLEEKGKRPQLEVNTISKSCWSSKGTRRAQHRLLSATFVSPQPSMSSPARCTGTEATPRASSTSTPTAAGPWGLSGCSATSQVRV